MRLTVDNERFESLFLWLCGQFADVIGVLVVRLVGDLEPEHGALLAVPAVHDSIPSANRIHASRKTKQTQTRASCQSLSLLKRAANKKVNDKIRMKRQTLKKSVKPEETLFRRIAESDAFVLHFDAQKSVMFIFNVWWLNSNRVNCHWQLLWHHCNFISS